MVALTAGNGLTGSILLLDLFLLMKILTKIPNTVSQDYATEQFNMCLYSLSDNVLTEVTCNLLPGPTVCLFSGGHRLPFASKYLEPKMFSHAEVKWQPQTIFVDPSNTDLLFYSLKKIAATNILILNTNIFIQYRTWQQISKDLDVYKKYTSRVIASLPIERFDFNRLKYTAQDITALLGGVLIDNTVIICR